MLFRLKNKTEKTIKSRTDNGQGHILITGTGRAGTTFLVQLLTALDFDTGFTVDQAITEVDPISKAGLEVNEVTPSTSYVIKSPWFVDKLLPTMEAGQLSLSTAIVPIRDLYAAAQSRRRVTDAAVQAGGDPAAHHPGGLWLTDDPSEQENKLATQYYQLMLLLSRFGIPTIGVEFPRLATDETYLFARLQSLMTEHGVSEAEFSHAYRRTVQPDTIHDFGPTP
ncbi:hypothetical protein [Acidisoma cladoniae]|uniref:hypothetical protein n=1 Tax=Acidisoma cladoniae TaxID=3040935 RepID=UPI00254F187A|nr:hypothetical protein [Acidisoma sp. PAMC 29798]